MVMIWISTSAHLVQGDSSQQSVAKRKRKRHPIQTTARWRLVYTHTDHCTSLYSTIGQFDAAHKKAWLHRPWLREGQVRQLFECLSNFAHWISYAQAVRGIASSHLVPSDVQWRCIKMASLLPCFVVHSMPNNLSTYARETRASSNITTWATRDRQDIACWDN